MQHSVNSVVGDHGERARQEQAQRAAEIIYRSASTNSSFNTSNRNYGSTYPAIGQSDVAYTRDYIPNNQICCGPMSPVRRTFCLLLLFDFLATIILWILYTQVIGIHPLSKAFDREILHYTFQTSLFDTVLCSAWRFVPLLLAYALVRLSHPWPIAVTTSGTCIFLLTKAFKFHFYGGTNDKSPLCYVVLIASFILAWAETWFLDFKVLPREKRAMEMAEQSTYAEHSSLLHSGAYNSGAYNHGVQNNDDMRSFPESQHSSEDESQVVDFHSLPTSRRHSRQPSRGSQAVSLCSEEQEYVLKAQESWEKASELYDDRENWKVDRGDTLEDGIVSSKVYPNVGKVFRLEGYVDCPPQMLFNILVTDVSTTHQWNPTVADTKLLQVLDDNTDIHYTVAADSAAGLVSSRDFVNIRHWKRKGKIIISAGCAVNHPDAPPTKKHVRGENRPGGAWIFTPLDDNPNRTLFCWIMNTDIKGWLPQWTVDQALAGTQIEFLQHLRTRVKNQQRNSRTLLSV